MNELSGLGQMISAVDRRLCWAGWSHACASHELSVSWGHGEIWLCVSMNHRLFALMVVTAIPRAVSRQVPMSKGHEASPRHTFANVSLATASHVAKPSFCGWSDRPHLLLGVAAKPHGELLTRGDVRHLWPILQPTTSHDYMIRTCLHTPEKKAVQGTKTGIRLSVWKKALWRRWPVHKILRANGSFFQFQASGERNQRQEGQYREPGKVPRGEE